MTNEFVCEACGQARYRPVDHQGTRYRWYCARCEGIQSFELNEEVPA